MKQPVPKTLGGIPLPEVGALLTLEVTMAEYYDWLPEGEEQRISLIPASTRAMAVRVAAHLEPHRRRHSGRWALLLQPVDEPEQLLEASALELIEFANFWTQWAPGVSVRLLASRQGGRHFVRWED